jgi:hypothetical protein
LIDLLQAGERGERKASYAPVPRLPRRPRQAGQASHSKKKPKSYSRVSAGADHRRTDMLVGRTIALNGFRTQSQNELGAQVEPFALPEKHPCGPADLEFIRDLNLSPNYLQQIEGFSGVRELVQMWFDEILAHAGQEQPVTRVILNSLDVRLAAFGFSNKYAGYVLQWTEDGSNFVQLQPISGQC